MKKLYKSFLEMREFLILWGSQAFSSLGSAMTAYAFTVWSYSQYGSALTTALLMVSSYAPYVLLSIFAGALTDRWNKKTSMLVCDSVAALGTLAAFCLLETGALRIWHLYIINAVNGLMNTIQQPASEVAVTRLLDKKHYQKVGGLRYLSISLSSILTPILATAVMGLLGMRAVIGFDFITFAAAFITLAWFIKIPEERGEADGSGNFFTSVKEGIAYLVNKRGIFVLIMFLAAINLIASMYNAALPAMILSKADETALGTVNAVIGISTLTSSIMASFIKEPKSRVRAICGCLLFSMSTENFLLAFGKNSIIWALGGFLGWILIPLMNANMDAVLRLNIPEHMQGRIYSVRNSFQFFTIPAGYFIGGAAVDYVFEPFTAKYGNGILQTLFGTGKGSGAAMFFAILAILGVSVCLYFRRKKSLRELDN